MWAATALLLAYLLGSVPFGYIFARRLKGIDVRYLGDGNVGTRNVWRTAGPVAGLATLFADVGKGYVAIALARRWSLSETMVLLAGFAVVLGHDFPLFLHFRGGQGMASTIGVMLALMPRQMLISLAVILILWALTRHLDFACGVGFALLPPLAWWSAKSPRLAFYSVLMLPTIGLKKLLDLPRARSIGHMRERRP